MMNAGLQPAAAAGSARESMVTSGYSVYLKGKRFISRYPKLSGQFCLELVNETPYLTSSEKKRVINDYRQVFRALKWTRIDGANVADLVPLSRSPFKNCMTFYWYAYAPLSHAGTDMRSLYRNLMFRECSTWYMTNKYCMLRRILLQESALACAVKSGLCKFGKNHVTHSTFMPATRVYSFGDEAATCGWMQADQMYIVKPAAGLQGRGISLYRHCGGVHNFREFMETRYPDLNSTIFVIQEYIEQPLLIKECKFDLRVYLLVVPNMNRDDQHISNSARGCYAFYHPGFVRRCVREYAADSSEMSVHLTNCSVQATEQQDDLGDSNWTPNRINRYFNRLFAEGVNVPCHNWFRDRVQKQVQAVMAYIMAIFARKLCLGSYNSFKLLGCDLLIDSNYRIWLLELNSLPSLRIRSDCQRQVKGPMHQESLALAIEVMHRSAKGLPITQDALVMQQNFTLIYSPDDPTVQGQLMASLK